MEAPNYVDTPKELTHISLCAGYGGIDLALHRVYGKRLRTIAFSEIEAFAVENLVAKMEAGLLPPAPVWTDLRTFPWADFWGVDLLSGGFPCQPFSAAGKRNADSDPRHLFPAILDGIRHAQPRLVFLENVEGIISAKLAGDGWRDPAGTPVLLHVLRELERVGYRATAGLYSASETGAPHQRKRIFILAYDQQQGLEGLSEFCPSLCRSNKRSFIGNGCSREELANDSSAGLGGKRPCQFCGYKFDHQLLGKYGCPNCEGGGLEDANNRGDGHGSAHGLGGFEAGPQSLQQERQGDGHRSESPDGHCAAPAWPSRPGEQQFAWEPPRVVVDAKSQRAGQRSELCGEECGSRSALSWDFEQSGEGAMANANELRLEEHGLQHSGVSVGSGRGQDAEATLANDHRAHTRHGKQRPERTLGDLSGGCSEGGGTEGLAHTGSLGRRGRSDGDAGGLRGEIQTAGSCGGGGDQGDEQAMGNSLMHGHPSSEITGGTCEGEEEGRMQELAGGSGAMGNADPRRLASGINAGSCTEADRGGQGDFEQTDGGAMGNAPQRKDNGRESRDMGTAPNQGRCGDHAADGTSEGMGNAECICIPTSREHGAMDEASGIPADRKGSESSQADSESSAARKRKGHGTDAAERSQAEPALGGDAPSGPARLDEPGLPALGDSELAEIYEWMVRCTNRTDELRLLGNGVCVTTGEVAFRTLFSELCRND